MNRIGLSLFLSLLIVLAFSQPGNDKRAYMSEYTGADNLYYKAIYSGNTGKATEMDVMMKRHALAGFKNILPAVEKAHDDSLAFYCYYKAAVLEHSLDSLGNAMLYYEKAVRLRQPDSLLFRPYLFMGAIQYSINQFDPALASYKKAEAIADRYNPGTSDAYHLYYGLGNMYYETANYSEASNYFKKAAAPGNASGLDHDTIWARCQLSLVAALMKLEKFNEASVICNELIKADSSKSDIIHKAGTISLRLGEANKAIGFFRRVHYSDHNQVRLLNDMGQAYESMGYTDTARRYYTEAIKENNKWPGKKAEAGLTLKCLADLDTDTKSFNVALKKYQEAIVQFVPDFNDPDIYKNPEQYSGSFPYAPLFDALIGKAKAFEKFYQRVNVSKKLEAALQTYRAAFRLADYVAQTYTGDDARLFLGKIKDTVRSHAIELSLLLYQQNNDPVFLEEAYQFDQLNKVSVFSNSIKRNEAIAGDSNLLAKEFSFRTSITRSSNAVAETSDSTVKEALAISIHDNELLLRKVQEELKKNREYAANHPADNIPAINQIQKALDRNTAVVSFHLSEKGLLAFVITDHKFDFVLSPITAGFSAAVDTFKSSLHDMAAGNTYFTSALPVQLYNTLIAPIRPTLAKSTRLVIIPGNELSDLPFEALRDKNGTYLIERFAVQYQYSTVLFTGQDIHDHGRDSTRLIIYNAYDGQPGKPAPSRNGAGIFSCTGCPGVITSLWKADNKTTTYITRRLDYYLKKGWTKDKALQKAKTDLLGNAEIEPRFKSPVYWAHLVFAGEYQPLSTLSLWWPLGSSVGVSFLIILLANLDSRRKRFKIRNLY